MDLGPVSIDTLLFFDQYFKQDYEITAHSPSSQKAHRFNAAILMGIGSENPPVVNKFNMIS